MRELGISTDLHQFVRDLGQNGASWDQLEGGLVEWAFQTQDKLENSEPENETILSDSIDKVLMLPTRFCLPLTFAEPNDTHVNFILTTLKNFAKGLCLTCKSSCTMELKMKALRCLVHTYRIASGVPLGIGLLVSVAILKLALDAVVQLMNSNQLSEIQLCELSEIVNFKAASFERMIIGEIGFVYFSQNSKVGDETLENWKINTRANPALKSQLLRIKIRKSVPMIDPAIHSGILVNFLNCLREFRSKDDKFGINDYRKTMENSSLSSRFARYFLGNLGSTVFRSAFLFQPKPTTISNWLIETISVSLGDQPVPPDNKGDWGFTSITRSENQVHSHLFLTSYFGNQLEYVVHLSPNRG